MRYARSILLSSVVAGVPQFALATETNDFSVFFRQTSLVYSDSAPLKLVADELRGGEKPENANHALTYNRGEIGFSAYGWELAYSVREDYVLNYSPDTMTLFYLDKNKKRIPDRSDYQVYLDVKHVKSDGWRLGYGWQWDDAAKFKVSLNYLEAEELLYGTLSGDIAVENGDINGGALQVSYHYHRDYFLKRKNFELAEGKGYSIDVEADIDLGDKWNVRINLYDLLGQIYWERAPYTDLTIAETQTYYDEHGYAHRDPVMQGMEGYRNFTQDLSVHYQVSLIRQIAGKLSAMYTREKFDKVDFDRLFLRYEAFEDLFVFGGYDFTMEASWFGVEAQAFSLQVAMDDWSLVDSKSLVLRLGGRWQF